MMERRFLEESVLVTGATGYIGSHIALFLSSLGYNVVALARDSNRLNKIFKNTNVAVKPADILDKTSLDDVVEETNPVTVIHAAGKVGIDGNKKSKEYFDINLGGTQNIAAACLSILKRFRFVHLSTAGVYSRREGNLGRVVNEETELVSGTGIPYIDSKVEAELALRSISKKEQNRMRVTTLRPGMVYGNAKGDVFSTATKYVPRILGLAKSPLGLPRIGEGDSPANVVHLSNLLEAVKLIVGDNKTEGEIYDIVDNVLYHVNITDYIAALMKKFEIISKGIENIPLSAARYMADMCEELQQPGSKAPIPLSRLLVILLGDSPLVDGRKLLETKDRNGIQYKEQKLIRSLEQGLVAI